MDHGFTKSMNELDNCYTMLEELHYLIIGGALIHKNCEGNNYRGSRIRPTVGATNSRSTIGGLMNERKT